MELPQRTCPMCEQFMTEQDGVFCCMEHGRWQLYGARLLVRAPAEIEKQPERVAMPWEFLTPART